MTWPDGAPRESHLPEPYVVENLWKWTWSEIKFWLAYENSWILADEIQLMPWFRDAISDPDVRPNIRPLEGLSGLTVRFGRKHARIQEAVRVWGQPATAELVRLLDHLFTACGVGRWSYPSTLGLELMRRAWPEGLPPQPSPRGDCWRTLQETMTGGRVDTIRLDERFPVVTELDLNMAYAAAIRDVPAGLPRRTWQKAEGYSHWNWRIHDELRLGPLHVRRADGGLEYPRSGEGHGWYWDIEIEQAKAAGVECIPDWGWVWPQRTNAWEAWATQMWKLRRHSVDAVAALIKLAVVAGIGALGQTGERVDLVPREQAPGGEPLFSPATGFDPYWNVKRAPAQEGGMLHVASFVRAQVRCWLYAAALPYACLGRLISTDYDALRVEGKVTSIKESKALGGWKKKLLHNVIVPKARWIESEEKVRMPGVSKRSVSRSVVG
jgi:hypothetical protein